MNNTLYVIAFIGGILAIAHESMGLFGLFCKIHKDRKTTKAHGEVKKTKYKIPMGFHTEAELEELRCRMEEVA